MYELESKGFTLLYNMFNLRLVVYYTSWKLMDLSFPLSPSTPEILKGVAWEMLTKELVKFTNYSKSNNFMSLVYFS